MMPAKGLKSNDENNKKSNKAKNKTKNKSEICRYLWYNEYYADKQNRLQRERLKVYLKHLDKEKVTHLVNFQRETDEILNDHKRCVSSTGLIRNNYYSIVKSRNNSALDTYLTFYSTGPNSQNTGFAKEELQEKFHKSVKTHKFKKSDNKSIKSASSSKTNVLKKICSDDDDSNEEDDDEDDDEVDYLFDKDSDLDEDDRKVLNYDDKDMTKKNTKEPMRRSFSEPLSKLISQKAIYQLRKDEKSAPIKKQNPLKINRTVDTKSAKARMNGFTKGTDSKISLQNRAKSAQVKPVATTTTTTAQLPAKKSIAALKRSIKATNHELTFAKFPNEALEHQYLTYLEMKERLSASKPDKTIIKIKMNRDPIFAKRYKQFSAVRNFGRTPEYDSKDCYIPPVSMTKKQIEKEREKIVNSVGTKYEHFNHPEAEKSKFLKQKIDAFIKTMSKYN